MREWGNGGMGEWGNGGMGEWVRVLAFPILRHIQFTAVMKSNSSGAVGGAPCFGVS